MSTLPTDNTQLPTGGCMEDNSVETLNNRKNMLNNANRTYPQSKCNINNNQSINEFYKGYTQFPIDFTNCVSRNKAFVISNDCKKFKFSIIESIPDEKTYMDKYNSCILSNGTNCQQYLDNLDLAKIDYTINDALNKCNSNNSMGNSCSVYNVNNIPYTYKFSSGTLLKSNPTYSIIGSIISLISICCVFITFGLLLLIIS